MIIKCKNCSGDNPIGSIFCRICGAKLSFDDIDADIRKSIERKKSKNYLAFLFRIITLLFVGSAFYFVYLVFDPFGYSMISEAATKQQESEALSAMSKIDSGLKGSYMLYSEQLNFLAKKFLSSRDKNVAAGIIDGKYLYFTYSEVVFNYYLKIQISKTAIIEPYTQIDDKGIETLSFKLKSVKVGNLVLPQYLGDFISSDFSPFANNQRLGRILKRLDKVTIRNNSIELVH